MLRVSINQEDITIINAYVPNNRVQKKPSVWENWREKYIVLQ